MTGVVIVVDSPVEPANDNTVEPANDVAVIGVDSPVKPANDGLVEAVNDGRGDGRWIRRSSRRMTEVVSGE
ncbi:MAG: hypothetical protein LBN12_01605 [Clostridiales Family XIII bacterium]|jgi:hypothetical protein|nr:hypothetical protein [Clostridiales Family XIII bacterium]